MQTNRNGIPVVSINGRNLYHNPGRPAPSEEQRVGAPGPALPVVERLVAAYKVPAHLHGKARRTYKWRMRQRALRVAGCANSRAKPKRVFTDWASALAASFQVWNAGDDPHPIYPYRCVLGHIHIGGLLHASKFLTGGKE